MSKPKIVSFDEWLSITHPGYIDENDCDECEGEGEIEEHCGFCGSDYGAECDNCGGTGNSLYNEYAEQREKDKKLIKSL